LVEMTRAQYDSLVDHARADAPNECCGLLGGKAGRVERVYRGVNADQSPVSYTIDPRELLQVLIDIEEAGLDLVGIYHSHTRGPAYPSQTDVRQAYYPEASYVVISLADPENTQVRAFRIVKRDYASPDAAVEEEEVFLR
jgi:[CysO sulfur-carrier protein]-S-L-cysteine hydrolase